jgi:acylphosphatase
VRRARVRIRGRVQGVFFRAEARARAESLGLTGWIRNDPDGSVCALFEGEPERVESMIGWCRRGPGGAHVDEVEISEEAGPPSEGSGFRVL